MKLFFSCLDLLDATLKIPHGPDLGDISAMSVEFN